jgi:hypothetical protein
MSRLPPAAAAAQLSWLGSQGVSLARVALSAVHGTGLTTSMAANAGDVLLSIPAPVWQPFSAATARQRVPAAVVGRVEERSTALGAGSSFCDAALLAYHLADPSQRAHSPYLSGLPPSDVPLLWPAPLRGALLGGTSAAPAAASQVALSDDILAVLDGQGSSSGDRARAASDERRAGFRWAQSVVLSRAHSGEGKPLALVPGLDLLNHGGDAAGAAVRFDPSAAAFELVATRAHAPGEHLLIDYGTRASHRLLRLYGFVPSEGDAAAAAAAAATTTTTAAAAAATTTTATAAAAAAPAAPAAPALAPAPGDEVMLPLLPSAAELAGAPEAVLTEVSAMRAALAACGVRGSALQLVVDEGGSGRVLLPPFAAHGGGAAADSAGAPAAGATTGGGSGAETATARLVLRGAVEAQMARQREGAAACAAIKSAGGSGASDEAIRQRARLCEELHRREAPILSAALAALQ